MILLKSIMHYLLGAFLILTFTGIYCIGYALGRTFSWICEHLRGKGKIDAQAKHLRIVKKGTCT